MVTLIGNVIGACLAVIFVGYFAYSIAEPPLTIIATACLALMIYSFYHDMRPNRVTQARGERT